MRAAISCQILEGDLPVAFRWEKNGQPVTSSLYAPSGIITRRMDEYSASLVIEQVTSLHSGNYTCIASNVAGSERYTIPLTVNGNSSYNIIIHFRRFCFIDCICFYFLKSPTSMEIGAQRRGSGSRTRRYFTMPSRWLSKTNYHLEKSSR